MKNNDEEYITKNKINFQSIIIISNIKNNHYNQFI